MNIVTLLPFILIIGAMFMMTRSAKNKQRQAAQMREQITPGTGIRTIGGLYATVKEIREDSVLLEIAPGVHSLYAKNAIGAVLEADEFDAIVHGSPEDLGAVVPDDASALTSDAPEDKAKTDLTKSAPADSGDDADKPAEAAAEAGTDDAPAADAADKSAEPKKDDEAGDK